MEIRSTSAFQSLASASSEAALKHWRYHCRPWVLMPRSWIGLLYWLHSLMPQTCSWPLIATGVPPETRGGFVVVDVLGRGCGERASISGHSPFGDQTDTVRGGAHAVRARRSGNGAWVGDGFAPAVLVGVALARAGRRGWAAAAPTGTGV